MGNHLFHNIGKLSLFILKRDRIRILIWIIGIVFFTLIVPPALAELYPTQQDRDAFAITMENPAMVAMAGQADTSHYTIGVMTAHEMLLFTALVVGLMSILLVNRHTRSDEEDGRVEMLRSLPVGRLSNMNASLLVLTITNIVLAFVTAIGLFALGIESMDLQGSLLYGALLGGTGIFFAALTAVFAQISENARGTFGFSIAFLLLLYLVRAIGDVSNEALSWISPLGWVTKAQVYGENNWWLLLLLIVVSFILMVVANYLYAIRDLGSGLIRAKSGRKYASWFLQSPAGLALRLMRNGIIGWAIGMFVLGASYGSVMGDLDSFFSGSEMLSQMVLDAEGEFSVIEQFIPMLMVVIAITATISPVLSMLKLYGEEKKNHIEHLIVRAVSRPKLMVTFLIISFVNAFIMLSLAAIGFWSAGAASVEGGLDFGMIYTAAIAHFPAIVCMISIAALLVGFLPRFSSFVWLYVFYSFIVLYLGGLFHFPDWVGKLSPFGYISQLPIEDVNIVAEIVLLVLSIAIMIIAVVTYNKRDIQG
ncbi:ABC transporter permease [Caldibacillus lycopersici]|uniref:ABC transporter permease n=1 Tax=Perspicuibacillus lycopersici TaxID=1325689 RepID=A0AAE3IR49_9BACI|nr:ABC transporter permease [Perspicuibacillus lycopersici]MCU9612901.1 ABC transporter permease [Perspicuibacillus lycopersici]